MPLSSQRFFYKRSENQHRFLFTHTPWVNLHFSSDYNICRQWIQPATWKNRYWWLQLIFISFPFVQKAVDKPTVCYPLSTKQQTILAAPSEHIVKPLTRRWRRPKSEVKLDIVTTNRTVCSAISILLPYIKVFYNWAFIWTILLI